MSTKSWAVVAGTGSGTGFSVAKRFSEDYNVVLLSRNPKNYEDLAQQINSSGGKAIGFSCDTSDRSQVEDAFRRIKETEGFDGNLAAAIYNVGGTFIRKSFLEMTDAEFESGWKANGLGAFHFAQATLPLLLETEKSSPKYPPTLIFTGATASLRGGANFSAFSTGKFGLRSLAQSLAREFGPKGIHIVHSIIDGIIDIERTKGWKIDAPDGKIDPKAIADSYWFLHTQPRTTFTFEYDIRPYSEKW